MREQILLYNIQDADKRRLLRKALQPLGAALQYVDRRDYLKPLGTLAGEKLFFTVDKVYEGPELAGAMLVMAGLSSDRVDSVLQALKSSGLQLPYKAVLTDTNRYWTSLMLFEELQKEHMTFLKGKN